MGVILQVENNKRRRFEYKVTLGKDINGNLLRKSFYSTKSRGDAKRKAEKFKAKYELELLCGGEQLHAKVLLRIGRSSALNLTKSHM